MAGEDNSAGRGAGHGRRWDVALSFAGAQRDYVWQVAAALKALGVRCFYDADEQIGLWGVHLAEELPRIYAQESAAVVVFISSDYVEGNWTRLERRAALARAVAEAGVYVLPARFDDSDLPGLLPDVVAVDLRQYTPEQFAGLVAEKVAGLAGGPRAGTGPAVAGRPLAEVTDPFALEVHRPIKAEGPESELPELPVYVPRDHDTVLGRVVWAAATGRSEIAVLVGGSSTGKTRACWEALGLLQGQEPSWRLWHPIDPSRPEAALRELPGIGPRTVVWLNEAQYYLNVVDGGLGERVTAGLRELLRDPARAPVLVLATLWPRYWDVLTARPAGDDPHAQARQLLSGHDITVPAAFTPAQLRELSQAGDARLTQAAAAAQDGQVTQFLAGAPELLARYRNAPSAAAALIHAAMDARRLGMGIGLPLAFLEAAAPGYLSDTEWDALGEDWLEQALAYTAVPCKGVRGPLTRIRPRLARSHATGSGSRGSGELLADGQAGILGRRLYRLADYLDQHGRQHRKEQIPPASFWVAAASHAFPGDQASLGDAAHARGLYRAAAQLHKDAAAYGIPRAAEYLATIPPLSWAAAHAPIDDPEIVSELLDRLGEAGTEEQAIALLHRDPASHVSLDDPYHVGELLDRLRKAGVQDQFTALAARAATQIPLDNPRGVDYLLGRLRKAGAQEQITALASRASRVSLDDSHYVAQLLDLLRKAGAQEQFTALASRAATQIPLDNPGSVGDLLGRLRKAGAQEQITALLGRDPASHVSLDHPGGVALLLSSLREEGAQEQVTALLRRDPASHVSLDDPERVADLLGDLQMAGAQDQVTALLRRDPAARVSLDDPDGVTLLLHWLRLLWLRARLAGTQEQFTALASRAAAHVSLDDPYRVGELLDLLRKAGAQGQFTALASRAARVSLDDPYRVGELLDKLREAGAQEQVTALASRAARVSLDDPYAVSKLLDKLRDAGAPEEITVLLRRDPASHVSLDDPGGVAQLLSSLREEGAQEQVTVLLGRDPASHVSLDDPWGVADLLDWLREEGAQEQITALLRRDPAARVSLDDLGWVDALLSSLREAGAQEQVTALASRLPGAGMFKFSLEQQGSQDRFRFGREADGRPAAPWAWDDLD